MSSTSMGTSTSRHAELRAGRLRLRIAELGEQLLLTLGQLLRHVDVDGHEEIPVAAALRRALALDPERLAARGARRDLERDGTVQRRHLHVRAERGLGVGHRQVDGQVVAAAAEDRMLADAHADVQIAGLATGSPGLSSPRHADPRSVLHACRHLHLHGSRTPDRAAPVARGTGGLDRSTRSRAGWTGLLHLEEALVHSDLPGPTTGRAHDGLGTGSGARTMTR